MKTRYEYNKTWRRRHPGERHRQKRRNYARGREGATNARQPWTAADSDAIVAPDRPADRALATRLGRSVQAIQAERATRRREGSAP